MITYIFLLTQASIAARNEKLKIKNSIRQGIASRQPLFFLKQAYIFFSNKGNKGNKSLREMKN
jgi:hypothetical protein